MDFLNGQLQVFLGLQEIVSPIPSSAPGGDSSHHAPPPRATREPS
jgi:hypothetical protein